MCLLRWLKGSLVALELFSERYSPVGGVSAEGVLNNLGQPSMHRYELLVREALQNCWDAKRPDAEQVHASIVRYRLNDAQSDALRGSVLGNAFPSNLPARTVVASPSVEILYFADFGTTGLGGPLRADEAFDHKDADFVNLVFNVGQPPDTDLGGGSYGFGKGAFYRRSEARVVVFHTACIYEGRREERLIAVGMGESLDPSHGARHTGRHWWGHVSDGEAVLPAMGDEAARIASAIGLPARDGDQDLGTTVAVVAPDLDGLSATADECMDFIGECVAWNFWPKLTGCEPQMPSMTVDIVNNGDAVKVPNPRTHAGLQGFVAAMDVLRGGGSAPDPLAQRFEVALERPSVDVGRVVVRLAPSAPLNPRADGPDDLRTQGDRATAQGFRHVALMRQAELVVKYQRCAAPAIPDFGYTGVFRCEPGVDQVFRASEPPSHDDWRLDSMTDSMERSVIRRADSGVKDRCKEFLAGRQPHVVAGAESVPLGAASAALMQLMPAQVGAGPKRPQTEGQVGIGDEGGWTSAPGGKAATGRRSHLPGKKGSPHAREQAKIRLGEPQVGETADGALVQSIPIDVRAPAGGRLRAEVRVCTGDGALEDRDGAPAGWLAPPITWRVGTAAARTGSFIDIPASPNVTNVVASVVAGGDLMIVLDVVIEELTGQ